jgi:hypothetical protein
MDSDTDSNKQRVLGYTDELGTMLKHVKNHMPNTRLTEGYPRSADDDVSFGNTRKAGFYYGGDFSLRVVTRIENEQPKNYFVVCDGATWNNSTLTSASSQCRWHGQILSVPCTYSEKDIDTLGAEWFTGKLDSVTTIEYDVYLFVHHLRREGWFKFVPRDNTSAYNNNVASCPSSFSNMVIGRVRITRTEIPQEQPESEEPLPKIYSYTGQVVTNLNIPIQWMQQAFSSSGQVNITLNTDNKLLELTNDYGFGGHYSIVLDIVDADSNAKFNSTLFTPNKNVRVVNPSYIRTGETNIANMQFQVNHKFFSMAPTYLTLPTAEAPKDGGATISTPMVALKYTRSKPADTSKNPPTKATSATLEFVVYKDAATMQAAMTADNAIMSLGTFTIGANTVVNNEVDPPTSTTTTTSVGDTDTTQRNNVLFYYQCPND